MVSVGSCSLRKDLLDFPGNTQEIKLTFHLARGSLVHQRPRFALVLPHEN